MLKSTKKPHKGSCPVEKVAELVGDPCSLLIVRDLLNESRRFGELQTSLAGISSRTLAKKLKMLEIEGIISREEFSEKPPRVEYALTKKGMALHDVIDAMRAFGKKYL